jgi:hypothetical protein
VGEVGRAAEGEGALGEALVGVGDGVLDAERLVPGQRGGRQTGADGVQVLGRLAAHPGAVGVLVGAGLVGLLEHVEAVGGVRLAVVAVGVGEEVELANVGAAVAVGPEHARQGERVLGDRHAHVGDAQRARVLAGEEAHATGHADGILDEAAAERDALGREAVELGSLDVRVAVAGEGVPAELVGVEDEDVRSAHVVSVPRFQLMACARC